MHAIFTDKSNVTIASYILGGQIIRSIVNINCKTLAIKMQSV
jgi:hypothetical protein